MNPQKRFIYSVFFLLNSPLSEILSIILGPFCFQIPLPLSCNYQVYLPQPCVPCHLQRVCICFGFCFSLDRESKRKKKTKSRPGEDPGSDPDLVSSGQLPEQALKAVGVTPGKRHEGSVQVLLEGKEDVDIFGVELTTDQVQLM